MLDTHHRPSGRYILLMLAGGVMNNGSERRCSRCGCVLSRYNDRRRCGPCGRDARLGPAETFWKLPEVRDALCSWDIGTIVRLYRTHTGATQGIVAAAVGVDQSEVSRLERGHKRIRDRRQLLTWTSALGVPDQLLRPLPEAGPSTSKDTVRPPTVRRLWVGQRRTSSAAAGPMHNGDEPIPSAFLWDADGASQAVEHALGHAMLDRRGFMNLVGAVLVGLAEDWLAIEPPEMAAVLRGAHITDEFVTRLEDGLPRLRLLEAERGGDQSRWLIDAELGLVADVTYRSAYSSKVGLRLHALSAELGRMAGWASFDAGMHSAAQRYWVAALHSAHTSGRRDVGANILKSMSLQCHDFNLPKEALQLAQRAREGAGAIAPRTNAMLALREARAYAALGELTACEQLLASADASFGRAGNDDSDPSWVSYFDEAEFHAQVGSCYLDLVQPRKADWHFERALSLFPETKVRDRATYLIRQASAQAGVGNGDQAAALLAGAFPLIRQAPSGRNLDRAREVRSHLPESLGGSWVAQVDHELATLVA
jgi:transcriptional regulator with XRE-family HTH domain